MFIPTTDTLTQVLRAFLDQFELGVVAVGREAWSLMSILTTIEIAIFGLWWALSGSEAATAVFRKILTIGFFVFVVSNYSQLLQVTLAGFAHTAETAAGMRVASIDDPSAIIRAGFSATLPALELARKKVGFSPTALIDALIVTVSAFGIFFAYCSLAIQVFITRIEFGLVSTLSLILIPFGVFRPTAFIAEKAFGAIIGFGIKLMVLAFIISVAWPILSRWALPEDPDWGHLLNMLASTIAIAVLAFHAPSVASAMLWGAPSLGTSQVKGAARTVASPLTTTIQAGAAYGVPGAVMGAAKTLGSGAWAVTKNFVSGERSAGVSLREAAQGGEERESMSPGRGDLGQDGKRQESSGGVGNGNPGQALNGGVSTSRESVKEAEGGGGSGSGIEKASRWPNPGTANRENVVGDDVPSLKVRIANRASSDTGIGEERGTTEGEWSREPEDSEKCAAKKEHIGGKSDESGLVEPQLAERQREGAKFGGHRAERGQSEELQMEQSERTKEYLGLLADKIRKEEEK